MSKRIVSLLLVLAMLVLAVPILALPATAEGAEIWSVTWDESNPDSLQVKAARNAVGKDFHRLYTWYDAEGNPLPVDGYAEGSNVKNEVTVMEDDCYGVFNQALYDEGILDRDMTWEEVWVAYAEYLKECSRITYGTGWTVGNMHDGVFVLVESRCIVYNASTLYGVRRNSKGAIFPTATFGGGSQFCTSWDYSAQYFDDLAAKGVNTVPPGDDGYILWSEIKENDAYLLTGDNQVMNYTWNAGAGGLAVCSKTLDDGSTQYIYGLRPDTHGPVALQYTVPDGIYGTATIDMGDYIAFVHSDASERDGKIALALNGEVVWPADATFDNAKTWSPLNEETSLTQLNEELANVKIDVQPGDNVQLLFNRGDNPSTQKLTVDIKPTINIEQKYLVKYVDQTGKVLQNSLVTPGAALPTAPMASADGFYINSATEAVTELPATVSGHMTIEYAGDVKVDEVAVEKVSITLDDNFSVNLYVKPDAYAVRVGAATDDLGDLWGVAQEDGTYKITLPGISVLDLDTDISLYLFQEFAGNDNLSNNTETYVLNPAAVLNTYATDEAYADVKHLAAAALDYMAAAHEYFEGESLDADVAARLATYDATIAALSKDVAIEDAYYDYTISAATLVLKERAAIKIRINLTEFDILTDEVFDFTVKVVDSEGNEQYCEGFTYQVGATYNGGPLAAVLTLNPMPVTDLNEEWQITVLDEDMQQTSATVTYSLASYVARTFAGGEGETDNLLRALYAYGTAMNG